MDESEFDKLSLLARVFKFLENGFVQTAIGILGGLMAVFVYGPILTVCAVLTIAGLHRSGATDGLSVRSKVTTYILLTAITGGGLFWCGLIIERHRDHIPTVSEITNSITSQETRLPKSSVEISAGQPSTESSRQTNEVEKEILLKLNEIQRGIKAKLGTPFPMFVGPTFVAFGKNTSTPLWISCDTLYGKTISPVKLAVFVGLLNHQSFATIIKSYKAEVRDPKGKWIALTTIDTTTSEIWRGYPYGISVNKSSFFDRLINNHTLQPGEPVIGWMLFDYPSAWGGVGANLRITVTDVVGNSSSVNPFKHIGEDIQGGSLIETGGTLDLSRLRLKEYSQRWNN